MNPTGGRLNRWSEVLKRMRSKAAPHPATLMAFGGLAILTTMLMCEADSLRKDLQWSDRSDTLIGGERELLKLTLDMETGLRGFQYTGKREFLQPYAEAAGVIDSKFAVLDLLVAENPSQKVQLAGIRTSFEEWRLEAASVIAIRTRDATLPPENVRYEQMLESKISMDRIRANYETFDSGEVLLRNKNQRNVRSEYMFLSVTSFIITFGGGSILALFVRRRMFDTCQKEHDEVLRRRDQNLRRVVWGVKDYAILMLDPKGLVITWNEGAERIKGYRAEEIIGCHFSTFYPAYAIAQGKPSLELKVAEENGRFEEEGWRVRKDGSYYWASVVITTLHDESGTLSGFAKVIRDIPPPKDTERALLTSEALRRAIFNSANFSKIATDARGVIQIFNVGAERMLGYLAAEVVNRITPADISDPQELVRRAETLSAELGTLITPGFEALIFKASRGIEDIYDLTYIRKDGSHFPAVVSVTALRDANDTVIGYLLIGTDNTARKRAEEALLKAGALQSAIFNSANFSSIATDAKGVIQIFNVGAERMLGYFAAEVVNKITPADISDSQELVRRAEALSAELGTPIAPGFEALIFKASRGIEDIYDLTYIRKDGRHLPAVVSVTALRDANDSVIGYLLIGTDNTVRWQIQEKRKQAEDALRASEAALRKSEDFLDRTGRLAGVGGWELDLLTNSVSWSAETARLFGVDPAYMPTFEESISLYAPEARPVVIAAVEKSRVDGRSWELEVPVIRADGRRIWARVVATVEFADAKPIRLVGAFQDVTARVAEQQALQEANTRATLATDSGGIGIWEWDLLTGSLNWNTWMYRLYGMTPGGPCVGNYELWRDHLHPDDREAAEQALQDCVKGDKTFDTSFRIVWDDESIHHLRATGHINGDDTGPATRIVGANWDVTDLIQADETSRVAMKIAEDSSRIKSDFLANMSHEVRTPMNAILGMTHLALRAHPTTQQIGYLTKIGNAAQSLLSIMNDILDFSKIEAGKLELEHVTFSLDDVWNDVMDVVGQKANQKSIAISFSVAPEAPRYLVGDPLRLGQILINLVNNAIKFTESGEVVVKVVEQDRSLDTGTLSFSVRDTGIGMFPEQVTNLFQSFNQADSSFTRKYGGTGLGLAISKQLCGLMSGTIAAQSEPGRGSIFVFTAKFGIANSVAPIAVHARTSDLCKKTVLVVDHSDNARNMLVAMLRPNGFVTRSVSSGEEALLALTNASQAGEPFDLVVMDWRLPGIDGIQTSRRIREHLALAEVPAILMVSAFDREEVMSAEHNFTLDGFLVKPISELLLLDNIATILARKTSRIPESQPASGNSAADLAGRRVLLVEDNEINLDLATELLGDLGILVSIAVNGQEGATRVASEPFDLVLMDIQMPVMDGLAATRLIRSDDRFRDLPIIAMTAHAMSGDRERSLSAGMNDHLTKPISPIRLTDALRRWMPAKLDQVSKPTDLVSLVTVLEERLPHQLLPFDMQAALVRTNGKTELLRKLLLSFHKQYVNAAGTMREYIASGRFEDAHRLAHSLKGIAATFEAVDLTDAASAVERAFRTGRTEDLDTLVGLLEQALAPAISAAGTLAPVVPPPAVPGGPGSLSRSTL